MVSQDARTGHGSPTTDHQGMEYGSPTTQQETEDIIPNDFYTAIIKLPTLHKNFMHLRRGYHIKVYRGKCFGQHHYIVIHDGVNEDITLELAAVGEKSAISETGEVTAVVRTLVGAKCSSLEHKGYVELTLYALTKVAADIINTNPHYNLLCNNCQDFCNKFLKALNIKTYMTDSEKAAKIGVVAGYAASSSIVVTAAVIRSL